MEAVTATAGSVARGLEEIRADFPVLARRVNGKPLVYVDNAATSQKPASVIEAISRYYRESNANIHRSMHALAAEATELYEGARSRVAAFVGAAPEEIVFVRNATEAINLVRFTWAREHVGAGDTVVVTRMEHHSNVVPWQLLCAEQGARLAYVELDAEGRLDLDGLDALLARGDVKLVALTQVSNVLGTINPVAEISPALTRGVQKCSSTAPKPFLSFRSTSAGQVRDFYAFTGHKMLGPTGIGVLWGRRELLEEMPPFLGGGSMIRMVEDDHSTWAALPAKFEAGTPAIAEAAGLGAAVDYLSGLGMESVRAHERDVTAYALERLAAIDGLEIYGPEDAGERGSLMSFTVEGVHPHDLAELCNREAVAIRAGHHCAQPLMRHLGVPATARASFSVYNGRDDVDRLADALEAAKSLFGA